jgi:hypothetical protein
MVRVEGVAPSRLSALVPKTSVSAYFTTRGWHVVQVLPPGPVGFGVRPAQAGARHVKKEMRSPGVAPGSSRWQRNSLLLTYDRKSQKEQTPTESKLCTAGHFPLAVFQALQEARTPLKNKKPHSAIC